MAMPGNMDEKSPCEVCGKRDDCMSVECCFNGWESLDCRDLGCFNGWKSPDCRNHECMVNYEGTCVMNVTDACGAHK